MSNQHPLTDKMIEDLWNDTSSSMVNMDDPIDSQVIRAAYDLGRQHEAEWQEGQPDNYQLNPLD